MTDDPIDCLAEDKLEHYHLRLYIAGQTPRSIAAMRNLRRICEDYLNGQYSLEVIDLMEDPRLARDHQILALPTLVRQLPTPIRKVVGDLSDMERVLVELGLNVEPEGR